MSVMFWSLVEKELSFIIECTPPQPKRVKLSHQVPITEALCAGAKTIKVGMLEANLKSVAPETSSHLTCCVPTSYILRDF
eukprot:9201592-Pyramimonas_sp.AAC.1